jgi:hypothetical protein
LPRILIRGKIEFPKKASSEGRFFKLYDNALAYDSPRQGLQGKARNEAKRSGAECGLVPESLPGRPKNLNLDWL